MPAMLTRHALDGALQHHRLVAGEHRIGLVVEVDLVLRGCVLGDERIDRDALRDASFADAMHQRGHVLHGLDTVGLAADHRAPTGGDLTVAG